MKYFRKEKGGYVELRIMDFNRGIIKERCYVINSPTVFSKFNRRHQLTPYSIFKIDYKNGVIKVEIVRTKIQYKLTFDSYQEFINFIEKELIGNSISYDRIPEITFPELQKWCMENDFHVHLGKKSILINSSSHNEFYEISNDEELNVIQKFHYNQRKEN